MSIEMKGKKRRNHGKRGYMGTESALNGLVYWLDRYMSSKFKIDHLPYSEKVDYWFKLIIKYGAEFIPKVGTEGKDQTKADRIAKNIQANEMFSHFTKWAKDQSKNITPNLCQQN